VRTLDPNGAIVRSEAKGGVRLCAGPYARLGGDIQLQLALACNATGKEDECIAILKTLEDSHPLRAISKQAKDLRFILEAPKLAIGEDEKVSVPRLDGVEGNRCTPPLSVVMQSISRCDVRFNTLQHN
jgi:hypothetical protein